MALLNGVSPMINEKGQICDWIKNLCCNDLRYEALRELALRSSSNFEMGIILWHTFGSVAALMQEITNSYAAVLSGSLTWSDSNRLCWAISLFQAIARHPETCIPFLRSDIMMFLLPILTIKVQTEPVEHVRLAVMGVIGGLVKAPSDEVISFLLGSANILSVICHFLQLGSKLSKLITAYILRRILDQDIALKHLYNNRKICFDLLSTMFKVVYQLALDPELEPRILKNIVGSYKRLTLDKYAKLLLQSGLMPEQLRNNFFSSKNLVGYESIFNELLYINLELGTNNLG